MQFQHFPAEMSESSLRKGRANPSLMARLDFEQALMRVALFQCVHLPVAVTAEENEVFVLVANPQIDLDVCSWSSIARCSYVAHLSYHANGIIIVFRYEQLDAAIGHRAASSSSSP